MLDFPIFLSLDVQVVDLHSYTKIVNLSEDNVVYQLPKEITYAALVFPSTRFEPTICQVGHWFPKTGSDTLVQFR